MIESGTTDNKMREELLQKLFEQMGSIMRQIHRGVSTQEPILSPPQARLLFLIDKYKNEGVSVKDLACNASMTSGAITQFVDVLIKKKLVIREEDSDDRRIVRLKLTPESRNKMELVRQNFLAAASRAFDVLNIDELLQLIGLLAKVSSPQQDDSIHKQ